MQLIKFILTFVNDYGTMERATVNDILKELSITAAMDLRALRDHLKIARGYQIDSIRCSLEIRFMAEQLCIIITILKKRYFGC